MTLNERKVESIRKEIAKYEKSLERYQGIEAKKLAKCQKLGCADWTQEDLRTAYDDRNKNLDQINAWFDYSIAQDNTEETKRKIENAKKRLEKVMPKAEEDKARTAEDEKLEALESKAFTVMSIKDWNRIQEEFRKWLEEFKADCLKDGVVIEEYKSCYIGGKTKSGKRFSLYLNDGWTTRSDHCYTLKINGETIFTSGLFRTAYPMLKR